MDVFVVVETRLAVIMCCKDAESMWKAPEQAEALRRKVQELTKTDLPPALCLEIGSRPAVSLMELETKQVLCSATNVAEALAALHCNGHVKLLQNLDDIFPSFEARFTDQHRLGAGNCSETFRMYDKVRGKWVFSKQLDVESGTWEREICALKSLKHPNIVTLLEDPFILDDKIHLICECMDADLRTYIRRIMPDSMSSGFLKGGLLDLLHAVSHLHHLGWIHRDLKPQNILVDLQNRCLKVADFGLSRMHHQFRRQPLTQEVVTLWYRAPELMLGGPYDKSIDIWSVGCVFGEMATGQPLFCGDSEIGQLFKIFQKVGTPSNDTWPGVESLPGFSLRFPQWKGKLVCERFFVGAVLDHTLRCCPWQRPSADQLLKMFRSWDPACELLAIANQILTRRSTTTLKAGCSLPEILTSLRRPCASFQQAFLRQIDAFLNAF